MTFFSIFFISLNNRNLFEEFLQISATLTSSNTRGSLADTHGRSVSGFTRARFKKDPATWRCPNV